MKLLIPLLPLALASLATAPMAAPRPAAKPAAKAPQKVTLNVPKGMMVAPFELPKFKSNGPIRGPVFLPKGARNVAYGKPVESSHEPADEGGLGQVVDGKKAGFYGNGTRISFPNSKSAPQVTPWVQISLKGPFVIHGVLIWHNFFEPQTYEDVIVQLSDDPDFKTNVRTVYNNDADNSVGLGRGTDKEYLEDYQGRWIPIKAQKALYVRVYGKRKQYYYGTCEYAEIEVWATIDPDMMEAPFELPQASFLG